VFPVIGKHPLEPGAEVGAVFRSKPIHVKDVREDAADLPEDTEERKDESQWEVPIDAM